MSTALIFHPVRDTFREDMVFTVVSKRFEIDVDLLRMMNSYFRSDELRPTARDDFYFVMNIFSGKKIKFPTVDQLYEAERDVNIYLAAEREYSKKVNSEWVGTLSDISIEYQIEPKDVHLIYSELKQYFKGDGNGK